MVCFTLFPRYLITRPHRRPLYHSTAGLWRRLLSIPTVILLECDCFRISPGVFVGYCESPCKFLSGHSLSLYDPSAIIYGMISSPLAAYCPSFPASFFDVSSSHFVNSTYAHYSCSFFLDHAATDNHRSLFIGLGMRLTHFSCDHSFHFEVFGTAISIGTVISLPH